MKTNIEYAQMKEDIKRKGFKYRLEYFWDYYKWHTIGLIFLISTIIFWTFEAMHNKEIVFYAALLNSASSMETPNLPEDFTEYIGIDTEKYKVYLDNTMKINLTEPDEASMHASQKMMIYTAAGEIDVVLGGEDIFPAYVYNDIFIDLRDLLSEEQIKAYEPYFYYADRAVMQQLAEANATMQNTGLTAFPDPTKPEDMEDPIPIALFVPDCDALNENYYFLGTPAIAITVNAPHPETALQFIDYLFQ